MAEDKFTSPLWWYDLITTLLLAVCCGFIIGVYLSYGRNIEISSQRQISFYLFVSIFCLVIVYLFGQFIGAAEFPTVTSFKPATVSVVDLVR